MIGLAHGAGDLAVVVAAAAGRQELGIVQEVQVVNGDHEALRAPQRRDEVRAVQQIEPQAGDLGGQRPGFQAVMAGRPHRSAGEVGAGRQCAGILAAVQDVVVRGAVQGGQMFDHVAGVRGDSALPVIKESGVDAYGAHGQEYNARQEGVRVAGVGCNSPPGSVIMRL